MSTPLEITQRYFELSNVSDFEGIRKLLAGSTTYSSESTGVYLGRDDIMTMQREFHGRFLRVQWKIRSAQETKPGVVVVEYDFVGAKPNGEKLITSGTEYVIVHQNKIQHIEIRAKS